jgi:hypothetical protein
MHIPTILGQGVFLIGFLLVAFARPGSPGLSRRKLAREPLDRLPDSSSLAGVPLRILHSERSGPGALLRDTLMIFPSTHE